MTTSAIISIIIAVCGFVLTIGTTIFTIGKVMGSFTASIAAQVASLRELVMFRLDRLETKQDKYNHLQERFAKTESSTASAHKRIDTLEQRLNANSN